MVRLGGAGKVLADVLARHIEAEIRVTVLGHLQRGGSAHRRPTALLATMYGCKVLDLVRDEQWDHMVALQDGKIVNVLARRVAQGAQGATRTERWCGSPRRWASSFGD